MVEEGVLAQARSSLRDSPSQAHGDEGLSLGGLDMNCDEPSIA